MAALSDNSSELPPSFIQSQIENSGTGLLAGGDFKQESTVFVSSPECSVLYTDYCDKNCSKCFVSCIANNPEDKEMRTHWSCNKCNSFILCLACKDEESIKWHNDGECPSYLKVPSNLRQGDSDYLRWMLRYFDIRKRGIPLTNTENVGENSADNNKTDNDLSSSLTSMKVSELYPDPFNSLVSNETIQSESFKTWALQFATLFVQHASPPLGIDVNIVYNTICRIKVNALGFPYMNDVAIGWCLDATAALLNHSCIPNCAVICNIEDNAKEKTIQNDNKVGCLEIRAIADIRKGEELTISYVDLTSDEMKNVIHRREHLKEEYLFDCTCKRCCEELEELKNKK